MPPNEPQYASPLELAKILLEKICIKSEIILYRASTVPGPPEFVCNSCAGLREDRGEASFHGSLGIIHAVREIDFSQLHCCRCFKDLLTKQPVQNCEQCVSELLGYTPDDAFMANVNRILTAENKKIPRDRKYWLSLPDEAFNFCMTSD
ncbi:hypothetical protein QAD02_002374 [Eretmocerus hayati]|uniref:Uncharacterized protein n=1 Tax=Eretmocerus hayati TaxID=131215 RepID=A0ACC2NNJ7_9HYME|nr:hypothetical protein QAD02_002374 [Eretmocerus hayati]